MNEILLKVAIFATVGFVASIFSMALKPDNTPKKLLKEALLSSIIAVVAGIAFQRFVIDELEIAGIVAAASGVFTADVVKEIREIIDKASDIVPNKFGNKKSDDEDPNN